MKLLFRGDTGKAVCEHCGRVTVTYQYRDVPLSHSHKVVKNILAGVCDRCGSVAAIPAQSTPAIKAEKDKATASIEALLPAPYIEVLDLAAFKVASNATPDMRKLLVLTYLHLHTLSKRAPPDWVGFENSFTQHMNLPKKRLSFKVSTQMAHEFGVVAQALNLNKTDTLKSIVTEIKHDILDRGHIAPEVRLLAQFGS